MPKAPKTNDSFTPEEQKQFDGMRDADKGGDEPISSPPPPPVDTDKNPVEAAPKQVAKPEQPEPKEPKENTMVPHAALEAERQRRKAAEQRDREREIEYTKVQERLNLLTQAVEASQKKEPAKPEKMDIPDPEKDALGAVKAMAHNEKLTQQEIETLRQYKDQRDKQEADRTQFAQITSWAAQQEREFSAKTPEYNDASAYLLKSHHNELMLSGYTSEQAQQQIMAEIVGIAARCRQSGKNPAELTLALAKARGYQPKVATPQAPDLQPPEQPAQPSAAEQIERLSAAQRSNRSLSEVSGNAPPGKMNAKDLAIMPDAQFKKILAAMSQQEQYEYFGN